MQERPILFSNEMVRAIWEGRKTQTRRVAKVDWWKSLDTDNTIDMQKAIRQCPYGQPGDRLWVRETFVLEEINQEVIEDYGGLSLPSDRPHFHHAPDETNEFDYEYWLVPHYRSTDPTPELVYPDEYDPTCKWRPSIFMPRWASRILLEIVSIRVERVQEISYREARAEGMQLNYSGTYSFDHNQVGGYQANFRRLWDEINCKRGYGWDQNPWVWVVEFKRVSEQ